MERNYAEQPLTVSELIAVLQQMPHDLPVWHQGCDCQGAADGALIENIGRSDCYVLITRADEL